MTADPITENTHTNGRHSNIVLHRAEVVRTCNSTLSRMTSTSLSCQEKKRNRTKSRIKSRIMSKLYRELLELRIMHM